MDAPGPAGYSGAMRTGWWIALAWAAGLGSALAAPLRVACIGDSITFGAYLPRRETEAYPARLETLSEGLIATTNLGVSGHTLIKAGRLSWWNSPAFAQAAAYRPDAVVVMLGTCDVVEPEKLAAYESDLGTLVDHFKALPSRPRVWLATPPPIPTLRQWKLNRRLNRHVIPAIHRVARTHRAQVIDVNAALRGRADLFPDDLHPNAAGADLIARTVWEALREAWPPAPAPAP